MFRFEFFRVVVIFVLILVVSVSTSRGVGVKEMMNSIKEKTLKLKSIEGDFLWKVRGVSVVEFKGKFFASSNKVKFLFYYPYTNVIEGTPSSFSSNKEMMFDVYMYNYLVGYDIELVKEVEGRSYFVGFKGDNKLEFEFDEEKGVIDRLVGNANDIGLRFEVFQSYDYVNGVYLPTKVKSKVNYSSVYSESEFILNNVKVTVE